MDAQHGPGQPIGGSVARRGVLAAVAALAAGALAKYTTRPVHAGNDGDLVLNQANITTGVTSVSNPNNPNSDLFFLKQYSPSAKALIVEGGSGSTTGAEALS